MPGPGSPALQPEPRPGRYILWPGVPRGVRDSILRDPQTDLSAVAAFLSLTEPPPPGLAEALLLPVLLLAAGALAGGLRTFLASPWRSLLAEDLPPHRRDALAPLLRDPARLVTVAGLLRALGVLGGTFLLVEATADLAPAWCWGLRVALGLLAALALEGAPALAARGRGLRACLLLLPLVRLLSVPLRPLTWLVERLLAVRPGEAPVHRPTAVAAGLVATILESGREEPLTHGERRMIERILAMPETDAAAVMTPRTEITAVPADASVAEALRLSREEGHSRIPVYEEDLDHILGVFYVKDVLQDLGNGSELDREPVRARMRPPFLVPETTGVVPLLEEMRRRRVHLAVVVDEYGGTAGVVTIEDLLEEIVGEIQDEHDPEGEEPKVERIGPGELLVDARLAISDLNEILGTDLPEDEDFDTLGGLLFDRFGHIPEAGEEVREDGVLLQVKDADGRRVRQVLVRRVSEDEAA